MTDGTSGNDNYSGSPGDDFFDMSQGGTDTVDGGGGIDTVKVAGSFISGTIDGVFNSDGSLTLTTPNGVITLTNVELVETDDGASALIEIGTNGNDTLGYLPGVTVIAPGPGDNTITPGAHDIYIEADTGFDTVILAGNQDTYNGDFDGSGRLVLTNGANTYTMHKVDKITFDDGSVAIGTTGDDVIGPVPGVNSYFTSDGNDTITPGAGVFTIEGDAGIDTVVLSGNLSTYTFSYDGDGDPVLTSGGNVYTLMDIEKVQFADLTAFMGTSGPDGGMTPLIGTSGNDAFFGAQGNDNIIGGGGSDVAVFTGNRAAYTITELGTGSVIQVVGPDGTDTVNGIQYLQFADQILQIEGPVYVGTSGDDTLTGTNFLGIGNLGDQFNAGQGGNDTLTGLDGNDFFNMGGTLTAADTIDGGTGTDTVNLNGNYPSLVLSATTLTNIEVLSLGWGTGSPGSNSYNITTNEATVAAGQTLTIAETFGNPSLLYNNSLQFDGTAETNGNFIINATSGNDVLKGGAGNDIFNLTISAYTGGPANWGSDTVQGGGGNDTANFGGSFTTADSFDGGTGADTLNLNGNYSTLLGITGTMLSNVETLNLTGSAFNYNFAVDNTFAAATGFSVSGGGIDSSHSLTFDGSASAVAFTLTGGNGNDSLTGGSNGDTIIINAGNDTVHAGGGSDSISGGANFGVGDVIDGGTGSDTLNLNGNYSSLLTITGTMLSNVETINLLGSGFSYNLAVDGTFASAAGLAVNGSAVDSSHSVSFDGSVSSVAFVLTGGAGNDTLKGGSALDSIDISSGGNDTVVAGGGNDIITATGAFGTGDSIDGGTGTDTLFLNGDYSSQLTITSAMLSNVEILNLAVGHNYNLKVDNTVSATGGLSIGANSLGSGNSLTFDGSAATTLNFIVTDGAGNDSITTGGGGDSINLVNGGNDTVSAGGGNDAIFAGATFTSSDHIDGGAGADTLSLNGTYASLALGATSLTNIETLTLDWGAVSSGSNSYNITTNDANVAAGQSLTVTETFTTPSALYNSSLQFDGSAETNGTFNINATPGNDVLKGGAGNDIFNLFITAYTGGPANWGSDAVMGGGGNDTANFAGGFTTADSFDGGTGTDTLNLTGDYSSQLTITGAMLANVEAITLGAGFNYNLKTGSTLAGVTSISGSSVGSGNTVTIDASAATTGYSLTGGAGNDVLSGGSGNDTFTLTFGGNDTVAGGAGNDTFTFNGAFTAADSIDGGSGGESGSGDTVQLSGNYSAGVTFGAATMVNVEFVSLGGGVGNAYNLTLNAATVTAGQRMVISGPNAADAMQINASAVAGGLNISTSTAADTVTGGSGNDSIISRGGDDIFNGGGGLNRLSFANTTQGVTVSLALQGASQNTGIGNMTLSNFADVNGTGYADALTGDGNANSIFGGGGNDTISGGDGNDFISIGGLDNQGVIATNAHADGGNGNDTLSFAQSPIQVNRLSDNQLVALNTGVTFDLSNTGAQASEYGTITQTGFENLAGTKFDDTLTGDSGDNILYGADGDDILSGGAGNDTLYGDKLLSNSASLSTQAYALAPTLIDAVTPGDDHLRGGAGDDYLDGGAGQNAAFYDDATGNVTVSLLRSGAQAVGGGLGSDTLVNIQALVGGDFNDTLTGDGNANVLVGNKGDDTLVGGGGDDALYGGKYAGVDADDHTPDSVAGHDVLQGGAGNDILFGASAAGSTAIASYADASSGVTVSLAISGAQAVGGGLGSDMLTNITGLIGSEYDDILTGNSGNNTIDGNDGTDTAVFTGAYSQYTITQINGGVTISGGPDGSDTLTNVEFAQFTDQTVALSATFSPQTITDTGDTAPYSTIVTEFDSRGSITSQTITTDAGTVWTNIYDTSGGQSWLWITTQSNGLGQTLSQTTTQRDGTHNLAFYDVDNRYNWSSAAISYDANWNVTAVSGFLDNSASFSNWSPIAGGFDTLLWYTTPFDPNEGAATPVTLTGGDSADTLYGGAGNDIISGHAGSDLIVGGLGNDSLTGGADSDTFSFSFGDGLDTITDFTAADPGQDVIAMGNYGLSDYSQLLPFISQSGSDTVIGIDVNNQIRLLGTTASQLSAANFVMRA